MKIYQASGDGTVEVENIEPSEGSKVKIKVTHVMPTASDLNFFNGSVKREYPFVFGHMAIGVISDDRPEYGLKRGTKVILNPYIVEPSDRLDIPGKVRTRGVDVEGFMKDFVFLDIEEFVPFPDEVEEEEAIFTEKIALAMAAINSFRVEKGDYMVIIGGGTVCNIIAQLALYFQLIPILIDNNDTRLAKARDKGIYYTVNSSAEVPLDRVKEITGGRMSEHTVIEVSAYKSGAFLFALSRTGGDCTLICENNVVKSFDADVSVISRKMLKVKGVSTGAFEFSSAINILAQKILNLDGFIEKKVDVDDIEPHLRDLTENPGKFYSTWVEM